MTAVLAEPARVDRQVPHWHAEALCRRFPELDWIDPGAADAFDKPSATERRLAEAACRIVCSACPLRLPCAIGALERGERYGIWGGLDFQDRKRVAAQYGYPMPGDPPAHGTNSRRAKWGCDCRECKDAHAVYESMRREKKRANRPAFARRISELREARGWQYPQVAERAGLRPDQVRGLEVGEIAPDVAMVTALARAFTDDAGVERENLAEELHLLAGTAVGTVNLRERRVLVMAGSRHDAEVRHVRALPAGACTGGAVGLRLDRAMYRRRSRRRR